MGGLQGKGPAVLTEQNTWGVRLLPRVYVMYLMYVGMYLTCTVRHSWYVPIYIPHYALCATYNM